ncbi:primosomal protein N' family DNA-binding protein [Varibaculum cambriense]|uniref:primosomal protein N' family DNA-binding protein n=1 Tax=Varibaculum cambriense TaxID=184870 RepID=UPI00288A7AE7|nr:hypothetical protein [Varibaculum cambriense]
MTDIMPRWSGTDPLAVIRSRVQKEAPAGTQQELMSAPKQPHGKWENKDPIARVIPDVSVFHLANGLDYTVPARLIGKVQSGSLVSVKIAGKLVHGWVRDLREAEPTRQRLRPISRVLSPHALVSENSFTLTKQVARRYAGNFSAVLHQAIPPRRANIEKSFFESFAPDSSVTPAAKLGECSWEAGAADPLIASYPAGKGLLDSLAQAHASRVVWQSLPEADLPAPFSQISQLISSSLSTSGSVLCLFPTSKLAKDFAAYWSEHAPDGAPSALEYHSELGANAHYRTFLECRFNHPRLVIGTRSAIFAPLEKLSLLLIWDEAAETYQEKTAPYWHTRQVAMLRSRAEKASLILGSFSRSPQAQGLIMSTWARELAPEKQQMPLPKVFTPEYENRDDPSLGQSGLSSTALQFLRRGLSKGPVLIQAPRKGGRGGLSCASCLAPVRCPQCLGRVEQLRGQFICHSCSHHFQFSCPRCGGKTTRASVRGHQQIGTELAAAFPRVPVFNCDADNSLPLISAKPALIVATAEQEPVASGGYAAALILDAGMLLSLDRIWAAEEALRRWANTAAKVNPGGQVMLTGDPGQRLADTFKQRTFSDWASQELAERAEVGIPPTAALAVIRGHEDTLRRFLAESSFPDAQVIGPVREGEHFHLLVRSRLDLGEQLRNELCRLQAVASRKKWGQIQVQVDPQDL